MPIFLRYCRAKLRPLPLIASALIVATLTVGLFFIIYFGMTRWGGVEARLAARAALMPLLGIQGILLMLFGTGAVTLGMAKEANEGMVDYQRLTPVHPAAKILGYLFGLPILFYILAAIPMPFVLACILIGEIPFGVAAQVLGGGLLAVILYHMTGLVAATAIRQRLLATLVSQILVFVLYFILPALSGVGFVLFEYLTVRPVFFEQMFRLASADPEVPRDVIAFMQSRIPTVSIYGIETTQLAVTALIQGSFIAIFFVVVFRKWRNPEAHLLGKGFAVGATAWLLFVTLGNALPLIGSGKIFFSQASARFAVDGKPIFAPKIGEGMLASAAFGLIAVTIAWIATVLISPERHRFLSGWRRAIKIGKRSPGLNEDAAPALLHSVAAGAFVVVVWQLFCAEMFAGTWFPGIALAASAPAWLALAVIPPIVVLQALREGWGRRPALFVSFFYFIGPLLLAAALFATRQEGLYRAAIVASSLSPVALPFYALIDLVGPEQLGKGVTEYHATFRFAFKLSVALQCGAAAALTAFRTARQRAWLRADAALAR